MIITLKEHNRIIEHKDKTINDYYKKIVDLEKELSQSKDLKEILNTLVEYKNRDGLFGVDYGIGNSTTTLVNSFFGISAELPDNVLVYVDDILGGKVIKQEGNTCILIDENGKVTTGLTKSKNDNGYNYKLVRMKQNVSK